jgi:Phosphotransferase enzyme family
MRRADLTGDMTTGFPTTPNAVTPEWLSQVLGAVVTSVSLTRIGQDESFFGGALYRLAMTGRNVPASVPASLIAKFAPFDPDRALAFADLNRAEGVFYARFAVPRLPVARCYFAAHDPTSGASLLLLEDLGAMRAVPFARGLGVADAQSAIASLAAVHARWWGQAEAAALGGSGLAAAFDFAGCWSRYRAIVAARMPDLPLSDRFCKLGDALAADPSAVLGPLLDRGPLTCLHRDPQADNMMFGPDGRAVLYDWQIMGRGRGVYDVAYLLISSLDPATRHAHERDLVAGYHAALCQGGVTHYRLEDCQADYVRCVVGKLLLTVVATVILDNDTDHKRLWRRADLARLLAFVKDHEC